MSRFCHAFVALVFALLVVQPVDAKEYEDVVLKGIAKGVIEFEHQGERVKLPVALSLKVFDDRGKAFNGVEGARFLAPENVVNIKSGIEKTGGVSVERIREIRFVSGKVAELPQAPDKVDLRPSPDFNGKPGEVYPPTIELDRYYRVAQVGDFVEYKSPDGQLRGRKEILEAGDGFVVVAHVFYLLDHRQEDRTKVLLSPTGTTPAKAPKRRAIANKQRTSTSAKRSIARQRPGTKAPAGSEPTEVRTVGQRELVCRVKKEGELTIWTCEEVPFDGVVKAEQQNWHYELVDFAWNK